MCEWGWTLCGSMTRLIFSRSSEAECQATPSTDRLWEALPDVLLLSAPWQTSPFLCLYGKICLLLRVTADRLDVSGMNLCWVFNFFHQGIQFGCMLNRCPVIPTRWAKIYMAGSLLSGNPQFCLGGTPGSFLHLCWGVIHPTVSTCTLSSWCIFFLFFISN